MPLTVEILRSTEYPDCSNNGMSKFAKSLCLMNVDGPHQPGPNSPPALLIQRHRVGNIVVVPADKQGEWLMFGGTFAFSNDSRFSEAVRNLSGYRFGFPVAIHDRIE